jgi:hypothetical protein
VLNQRRQAVDQGRTLTHWANQVAALGAERPELAAAEDSRVQWMRQHGQRECGLKALVDGLFDLSEEQLRLV